MQKIPLSLAKAGFVLAKPVLRDNGMVLVAEGTELTEALLARLASMEVASLTVEGAPVDMEGAMPATPGWRRSRSWCAGTGPFGPRPMPRAPRAGRLRRRGRRRAVTTDLRGERRDDARLRRLAVAEGEGAGSTV